MFERFLGLRRNDTFGSVLARHRGIGPGFDVLRIALALLIMIGHSKWLAGGESLGRITPAVGDAFAVAGGTVKHEWVGWTRPLKMALVPAFFTLSGFLVAGSALRLRRVSTFLAHRGLRIFPALVVEVLLSAFVLGAAFTTLPLGTYFSDPAMHRYLLNMVGEISFLLPGVFEHNAATPVVNVNLWTLPAELGSYLIVTALMLTGLMYNRYYIAILAIGATIVLATLHFLYNISATPEHYPHHVIIYYFVLGLAMYHWRDYMPANPLLVVPVLAIVAFLLMYDEFIYVAAPLVAWVSLWIGMIAFPRFRILESGDYSYGIYLYSFRISQALIAIVPWFYGHAIPFIAASLMLAAVFAAFSWHVVEKRILRLKRRLPENWFPTTPRERVTAEAADAPPPAK